MRFTSGFLLSCLLLLGWATPALAELQEVHVGGQSIGILLHTDGVTVVGLSPVVTEEGAVTPASDAGLEIGDYIISINDNDITCQQDVSDTITQAGETGQDCTISYLRNNIRRTAKVTPKFCLDSETWRIGLTVRDSAAGVGTLTFWDESSGIYGALGHPVSDLDTGGSSNSGAILRAVIQGIKRGSVGNPGEKLGVFSEDSWRGDIDLNGDYGVYGHIDSLPLSSNLVLPIAERSEVELGPATIYTVVNGEEIESFSVEIVRLAEGAFVSNRGMVISITDEKLLQTTGGIVQGMSGSPIVQNDRLVGAVTHVFVNDPTQGYACYAEQMLEESSTIAL